MKTATTFAALVLAAATGSAAFAASDAQVAQIESFANVDISGLSDAEVNSLLNVIHGGDSISEKRSLVQNLVGQYR
ncbi:MULTISPECIES: hypothetical protein [unclassified Roseivivax]|uniref:hypothetical protein n=1 Tax=Roseivivax sp. GX 12232 TaxID=2900547 RepID=UPI001E49C46A|nr:hypothetical protein [Roseivivax sp. GX 12232]MCE0504489.1 hypothetical protein [Roseivivax sp. GX 12232]